MPLKKEFATIGSVEKHREHYRARAHYVDEAGALKQIRGPYGSEKHRAEADLAQMRAAAAVGKTREQGFEIMELYKYNPLG